MTRGTSANTAACGGSGEIAAGVVTTGKAGEAIQALNAGKGGRGGDTRGLIGEVAVGDCWGEGEDSAAKESVIEERSNMFVAFGASASGNRDESGTIDGISCEAAAGDGGDGGGICTTICSSSASCVDTGGPVAAGTASGGCSARTVT